jgi:hypothetical protein
MNLDFFENKYFFAVFSVFMFMYAAQIRPTLPKFIMDLFQNPIFRVAILFLVLVRGYKDPQFSLIIAVAFLLIMNVVNEQLFKETFSDVQTPTTPIESSNEQKCGDIMLSKNTINFCIDNLQKKQDCSNLSNEAKNECVLNNASIEANQTKLDTLNANNNAELNKNCNNVKIPNIPVPSNINCKDKYKLQ